MKLTEGMRIWKTMAIHEDNKTYRKHKHLESNRYALRQWFPNFFVCGTLQGYFKWTRNPCQNCQVITNAFFSPKKLCTIKVTIKQARSNDIAAGQCAGEVPSEHSQGQALVEPLDLIPGVTRHLNTFFAKPLKKWAVYLPHTPLVSIATGWKW